MVTLLADVRYGLRLLLKQRGFTIAALCTLALCIGANSAIFSVVNSVLIRPLPFPEGERIVRLMNSYPNAGAPRGDNSAPDYFDRLEGTTAFSEISLMRNRGFTVGEQGSPELIRGMNVTPSFFRLLALQPAIGRWFSEDEAEQGNTNRVILSYGLWQERFGGRSTAIGSNLRIDGEPYQVVGIMPRNFAYGDNEARLWTPLYLPAPLRADDQRHNNNYEMIARLKPGVSLTQAQAQIERLNQLIDQRFPQFTEILKNAGFRTIVTGYNADLVRDVADTLWLLQAGVLLVLLIGCVNLANLLLVRSTARHRELATRSALGAARIRLVRQMLTESVVLSLAGGVLGLLLAYALVRSFSSFAPELLPRGDEVRMDWVVAGGTLLLAFIAGLVFGTIPVVRVLRANLSSVFREEGRSGTANRAALLIRSGLVVAQVALAFALLIATGLMIATFKQTLNVPTGFRADGVLTASVAFSPARVQSDEALTVSMHNLIDRVRAIPGVTSAGYSNVIPFGENFSSSVLTPEGYQPRPGESLYSPSQSVVSSGYFETMGIELVRGRYFDHTDIQTSPRVMIIDEALARRFWPGQDPIGQRALDGVPNVGLDEGITTWTVVGVVKTVRLVGFTGQQPDGQYYFPADQQPRSRVYLTMRTSADPTTIVGPLRKAVASLDPDLPVYDVQNLRDRMSAYVATDRLRLVLMIGFALVAVFLSGVGLYGVLAYTVAQRTGELCIRMALGSSTRELFRLVLANGLRLTALGLAIGLTVSLIFSRMLQSLLFGVQPNDPMVIVGVFLLLSATAAVACYIPARRATRLSPMLALRDG
jgi:predicted permease